jgi:hypothetical protein
MVVSKPSSAASADSGQRDTTNSKARNSAEKRRKHRIQVTSNEKLGRTAVRPNSLSKKYFRQAEQVFLNPKKFRKTYDLIGAGHPSWVPRAHPSFPSSEFSGFIDTPLFFYSRG